MEDGICLGQRKTRDKCNEITAILELLDMLCLDGSVITIDAMGTQTAIAEKIVDGGADYIWHLRNYWAVENSLHWILDMSFGEDCQRKSTVMSAESFDLVRKFSLRMSRNTRPPRSCSSVYGGVVLQHLVSISQRYDYFFNGQNIFYPGRLLSTLPCPSVLRHWYGIADRTRLSRFFIGEGFYLN